MSWWQNVPGVQPRCGSNGLAIAPRHKEKHSAVPSAAKEQLCEKYCTLCWLCQCLLQEENKYYTALCNLHLLREPAVHCSGALTHSALREPVLHCAALHCRFCRFYSTCIAQSSSILHSTLQLSAATERPVLYCGKSSVQMQLSSQCQMSVM